MRLSDFFSGGQVNNTGNRVQQPHSAASNATSSSHQTQSLTPGQTIQGEVVGRNGNEVQIKLSDDTTLNARIDQNMQLETGKTMTFEVRTNGQTLTLSPLFANVAADANVLKALDMAALPVNQSTVSMTGLMMEAGLAIDRGSLQQMFREVNAFRGADVSNIIDLHKLGLPVNAENLTQIDSYKNLTHQLVNGMREILDSLPETMQTMVREGNIEGAARVFQELLQLVQDQNGGAPETSAQAQAVGEQTTLAEGQVPGALQEGGDQVGNSAANSVEGQPANVQEGQVLQELPQPAPQQMAEESVAGNKTIITETLQGDGGQEVVISLADGSALSESAVEGNEGSLGGNVQNGEISGSQGQPAVPEGGAGEGAVLEKDALTSALKGVMQETEGATGAENASVVGGTAAENGAGNTVGNSGGFPSGHPTSNGLGANAVMSQGEELAADTESREEAVGQDIYRELARAVSANDDGAGKYTALLRQFGEAVRGDNVAEQINVLQKMVQQGLEDKNHPLLKELMSGKSTQKLLAGELSKKWTIEPQDVADSKKVDELYQRLDRQLRGLHRILEQGGDTSSRAYKAVNNMSQNLDFLQQLNHTYTYVQLPLRLQQGDAHGDLYVYTNKRNLAAKDGQISALLHLDMEYLGPVDVYVAMQAEKVSTRFYVQDDAMLDFLEGHMDLLTQRLQKRGYDCTFAMQVRNQEEKPESGLNGLMAQEKGRPIVQYAFDMRA